MFDKNMLAMEMMFLMKQITTKCCAIACYFIISNKLKGI